MKRRHGFTLIELVAVIVVLAILSAVALPRYFDYGSAAADSADEGAINGIRTALNMAFVEHRYTKAPVGDWITSVSDIAAIMETDELPEGIVISGAKLEDLRGYTYTLTAETTTEPARLTQDSGGGGGGGGWGGWGGS